MMAKCMLNVTNALTSISIKYSLTHASRSNKFNDLDKIQSILQYYSYIDRWKMFKFSINILWLCDGLCSAQFCKSWTFPNDHSIYLYVYIESLWIRLGFAWNSHISLVNDASATFSIACEQQINSNIQYQIIYDCKH